MNPNKASTAELSKRMIERRAVEAVVWGMPIVNYDRMFLAARAAGVGPNQIISWSRPFDWKNQTLTPNPNTLYLMPFIDTSSVGPVVLEIPPAEGGAIVGSIDDIWQMPNMPDLQKNADGTVDVWFGPEAPEGKESNWIPTNPDGRFEALFRFFGPEQPLFDKSWVLPDIEKVG